MDLSPKATRFIIESLGYRIKAYQDRLKAEDLDEDEASDITNDSAFLEALRGELEKTSREIKQPKVSDAVLKVKRLPNNSNGYVRGANPHIQD